MKQFFLLLLISISLAACTKDNRYEEDPWTPFGHDATRHLRETHWQVIQLWVDGIDSTAQIMCDTCHYFDEYRFYDPPPYKDWYYRPWSGGAAFYKNKLIYRFSWKVESHDMLWLYANKFANNIYEHGAFHQFTSEPDYSHPTVINNYMPAWKIKKFSRGDLKIEMSYMGHTYIQLWKEIKK